jgi:hypothetical protein
MLPFWLLGVGTTDQDVPFQDSIKAPKPNAEPIATQKLVETHDTPLKKFTFVSLGLGTTDQDVPFQDCVRV